MKKVLSVLSLMAILGMSVPAFAAPPPPGAGGGPGMHGAPRGGHKIHARHHHRPPTMRPHHGGAMIHVGHHPRHGYWRSYGPRYWGSPWCDYRLGWCDPYYPGVGVYVPMGGASFSLRF